MGQKSRGRTVFTENTVKKVLNDNKGKFYVSLNVYYAYDITDENKEKVFKDVYNLYRFLEENGVNTFRLCIRFYSTTDFKNKTLKQVYDEKPSDFVPKHTEKYNIFITYKNMGENSSYKDVAEYFNMPLDIKYGNKLKNKAV